MARMFVYFHCSIRACVCQELTARVVCCGRRVTRQGMRSVRWPLPLERDVLVGYDAIDGPAEEVVPLELHDADVLWRAVPARQRRAVRQMEPRKDGNADNDQYED